MPLPTPNNNEKKSDFISRCMSSEIIKKDFKENDQRLAVCYRQFEEAKKESKGSVEFNGDEILIIQSNYDSEEENEAKEYDHEMTISQKEMEELHEKGETYVTETDGDQKMVIKVKYSKEQKSTLQS